MSVPPPASWKTACGWRQAFCLRRWPPLRCSSFASPFYPAWACSVCWPGCGFPACSRFVYPPIRALGLEAKPPGPVKPLILFFSFFAFTLRAQNEPPREPRRLVLFAIYCYKNLSKNLSAQAIKQQRKASTTIPRHIFKLRDGKICNLYAMIYLRCKSMNNHRKERGVHMLYNDTWILS